MNIIEIIQTYGVDFLLILICLFLVLLAKGVGVFDTLWGHLKGYFDKEHEKEDWKTKLEKKTEDADAERKNLSDKIDQLFLADQKIRDDMERTDQKVLAELSAIHQAIDEQRRIDDERHADSAREYILNFNMELVRDMKHTRESYIEVLTKIDEYEQYCRKHEDYKNNRALAAIENIKRVYAERLQKNDFIL